MAARLDLGAIVTRPSMRNQEPCWHRFPVTMLCLLIVSSSSKTSVYVNEYGHCLQPLAGVVGISEFQMPPSRGRACDIKFARSGLALSSCGWSPSRRTNTFSRPACIKIADLRHHPGTSQPEGRNGCGSRDLANTGIVVDSWYRGAGAGYLYEAEN